ncbi:MAG: NUDIX domain-containing protein [Polyangiaceae bacterium]
MVDLSEARFCLKCGAPMEIRPAADDGGRPRAACTECRFVFYGNPVPVAGAIVEHPSGIVLVRAAYWPEKFFGLVTGYIEQDESPAEACVREVKEELGLDGEVVSLVGVYDFRPKNELIVAYHVKATGTIALSEELAEYKVVPQEKLRPWPFGTGEAVKDWLAQRGRGALPSG